MGILVIACAIAIRFNKKIEETLAPAILGCSLILYLSGRAVSFALGLVIMAVLAVVAGVYCVISTVRDRQSVRNALCTWGGLALLIYMAFFAYYAFHRDFSHPDELYCWGLLAKDFYNHGTLFGTEFTSFASDQAPLMPIWFYFGARTWLGFSDSICFYMHSMLTISLILPVFAHIRSRMDARRFWVITAMLPSILIVSGLEGFQYALADIVLAAGLCFFFMCTVRFVRTGDHFYYVSSVMILMSMCLFKRIGAVFAALMIMSVAGAYLKSSAVYIRELGIAAVTTALMVVTWFGVSVYDLAPIAGLVAGVVAYVIVMGGRKFVDGHKDMFVIVCGVLLLGLFGAIALGVLCRSAYGYAVTARFMSDLFSVSVEDGFIHLSYGVFMLIPVMAVMILRRRGSDSGDELIGPGMWTVVSMAVYAVFMLYMHITQIGMHNDYRESLIPRYMIPWEVMALFFILYVMIIDTEEVSALALVLGLVVVLLISDTGEMYRGLFAKHQCAGFHALEDAGVELKPGDMIYYVDEEPSFGYSDREFYYHASPARTNFIYNLFYGTNGVLEIDADEWASELMGQGDHYYDNPDYEYDTYDYVYIQSYSDDFAERYGGLFENTSDIAPGTAYRVVTDGDGVVLRRLP